MSSFFLIWLAEFIYAKWLYFQVVCSAPITGIPTREEQGNLLLNVQEIFDELKMLLQDETNGTETSILSDVEKVVKRAKYHLSLVEELAFMSKIIL